MYASKCQKSRNFKILSLRTAKKITRMFVLGQR